MKKIKFTHRCKGIVAGVFMLTVVALLSMSNSCLAADFVKIELYPQHVGVFTTVGTQQFVAFGIEANGNRANITDQVDWLSSNEDLVTFDENGLATVVAGKTFGQVAVTCSYPKTNAVTLAPINHLLLSNREYTVIADADGNGSGSVSSDVGGISYAYPTFNTSTSTELDLGSAITLTATAATGSTVSWSGCDSTGGTPTVATCMLSSLDANKTVTATFTLDQFTVTVNADGTGSGTVTSSVGGISYVYPATGIGTSASLDYGSTVVVSATAGGTDTASWNLTCGSAGGLVSGNDTQLATCTFSSLDGNETLTATFTLPLS